MLDTNFAHGFSPRRQGAGIKINLGRSPLKIVSTPTRPRTSRAKHEQHGVDARQTGHAGNTARDIYRDRVDAIPVLLPTRREVSAQSRANRLARSEARLLAVAICSTAIVVGVLVVYLAAYAKVASLGIQQAEARQTLRDLKAQNEILREQSAVLCDPHRIVSAAVSYHMLQGQSPICYIASGIKPEPTLAGALASNDTKVGNDVTSTESRAVSGAL